jgi:predicted molibdopterin-dependent oxidoreductase YjgC
MRAAERSLCRGEDPLAVAAQLQPYPVDASHPLSSLNITAAFLCRRCVRACGELVGNFTLGIEEAEQTAN